MLKFKLDQTAFDTLNDVEKTFYKQEGDVFQLEVDGAADKNKLDEFRTNNVDLMKRLDQFKGVDMDKVNNLMSQERKLKDAEFIEKKDFEGLVESRTKTMKSDYESKLLSLQTNLDSSQKNHTNLISRHEIEGAANTAFSKHKISPDATEAVMSQIKSTFSVNGGSVVAMDGENIKAGANGNLTIDEFVGSMPEIFKIQSNGGGGNGGGDNNNQGGNKSSREKITSGLNKLAGKR